MASVMSAASFVGVPANAIALASASGEVMAEVKPVSDAMAWCDSQSGLRNVPATQIAVKAKSSFDMRNVHAPKPPRDDALHPRHIVLAWMKANDLKQADVKRLLGHTDHQKLSAFLDGRSGVKAEFVWDLANLCGYGADEDFKRFRLGVPSRNHSSPNVSEPLRMPHTPLAREERLRPERSDAQTIPLLDWRDLLGNALRPQEEFSDAPRAAMLRSNEAGPRTKAVRVNDNSMDPELPVDHVVVFDPDAAYGDGDIVLVRMHDGTTAFRKYTVLSDGSFDVHSTRPAQTWNSVKHGIVVLAPMICVYRERPTRPRAQQPG